MKKLGILNAINPATSEINWNDTPFDGYTRLLKSVNAPYAYEEYRVALGEFPPSPTACDAYLITGSPSGAYEDEEWIIRLAQFIRESYAAGVKLVGICFGHQILAQALGGRVEKSKKGWGYGAKPVAINTKKAWMGETADECALYFVHQDQVMELPPKAELLGGSAFCPIGLYTIEDRVFAIQGHPEFTAGMMEDVASSLKMEMEDEAFETAVDSLHHPTNGREVARWIVNFLES